MIWLANRNRIRQSAPITPGKISPGMADLGPETGERAEQSRNRISGSRRR
jgi:hypothetical protein